MKYLKIVLLLLGVSLLGTGLLAQDKKSEKKEKVIIIHKSDDGEETRQEIIIEKSGEEGENAILKINGEEIDIDMEEDFEWIEEEVQREVDKAMREVEVELKKMEDGLQELHLHYTDEDGEEQTLHWQGEDELPDEIRQELEKSGIKHYNYNDEDGQRLEVIVDTDDKENVYIISNGNGQDGEALHEWAEEKPVLELEHFEAYPNPASDLLKLSFKADAAPVSIRIIDGIGKTVYKEKLKNFDGNYEKEIGLQGIPEGALVLIIEQNDKVYTEKVMLSRM